ncbi:MAG TPA: hypothetical protein VNZ22_19835, partial [Bacillota bacterium]|nr:hypothetical protein [Bacillota bacterium]
SLFGLMLLLFLVGHSLVHAVLRRLVRPDGFRRWYGGFCLVFGLLPLLILGGVEWYLSRSIQLQSTQELYRVIVVLTSAVTLPYFVFFCFVLLATRSCFYSQRLAQAFGVTELRGEKSEARNPKFETNPNAKMEKG